MSIVVLISGNGSNLQALIDKIHAGPVNAEITAVVSNNPDAYGLERARQAGIPALVVDHRQYRDRKAHEHAVRLALESFKPDLLVLAGYMRILSPDFVKHYRDRILNIHPSLLPDYKGLDTHRRVIAEGERLHGASVHFVSAELDGGPVVIQRSVPIDNEDSPETLQQKVHKIEHQILPRAVRWFIEGRLRVAEGRVLLNGTRNPKQGPQPFAENCG